jgi:hypothetical protein
VVAASPALAQKKWGCCRKDSNPGPWMRQRKPYLTWGWIFSSRGACSGRHQGLEGRASLAWGSMAMG